MFLMANSLQALDDFNVFAEELMLMYKNEWMMQLSHESRQLLQLLMYFILYDGINIKKTVKRLGSYSSKRNIHIMIIHDVLINHSSPERVNKIKLVKI